MLGQAAADDAMPDEPSPKPALTPRAQADLEARRAREAAALRENLRRRKQPAAEKPLPART
jgi:hypothetical protein